MLQWFQAIMPKEDRFFDLFNRHALVLVQGAEALRDVLGGGEAIEANCRRVMEHENAADDITREVLLAVHRTFITPFDRGDIQALITSMDDAIDQMQKTAKAVMLFEVSTFDPAMAEMGDIIVQTARLTAQSVPLLKSLRQNAAQLSEFAQQVTGMEDDSDNIYERGMKALFLANRQDAMAFTVGAEIYDHLEKVMDRLEDVANRVSGILVEHI